ncbi:Allantoicase [Rhizopus azygosporus]|uniref:Allantoicase n=1 Tax=Rhizopus azygosporus TaxID=86630 RepID=A0A367J2Z5_RHIAZ|nr:Allantoicase [Rhizopus azygosporus]
MSFLEYKQLEHQEFIESDLSQKSDVANIAYGSSIAVVTNDVYDSAFRIIKAHPPKDTKEKPPSLKDGWEVNIGSDKAAHVCTIRLGHPSNISGFDIDTSYFHTTESFIVSVECAYQPTDSIEADHVQWIKILDKVKLSSSSHNFFELKKPSSIISHIRIYAHSNGGIARFHAYSQSTHPLPNAEPSVITARPLTTEDYAPYGDVIHTPGARSMTGANQGTASKYHHVAQVNNLFPRGDGKMNLCIFRCKPTEDLPFTVKLLERHPYSTQAFIPMTNGGTRGYLVVVALNGIDDRPDLSTIKAFIATSTQGINYRQGVWHHPMIALDCITDFAVIVHESGVPEDDCNEVNVPHVVVRVPGFQANL